jgi:transposase
VTVLEILRLTEMGYSQRKIGSSVKCSKSTVGDIQRRCREIGLSYIQAVELSDQDIKTLVYPVYSSRRIIKPDPDFDSIQKKLQQDTNKNLQYLWEEYRLDNPEGLSYSQFCERFRRWKIDTGQNVTMHIEREPGKELLIDWMGDTLEIVMIRLPARFSRHIFSSPPLATAVTPTLKLSPIKNRRAGSRVMLMLLTITEAHL